MSIKGIFTANAVLSDTRAVGLVPAMTAQVNQTAQISFTDGAGANQANVLFQAARTLSGTTDSLDLNGVLTDSFGSTVSDLRVKAILVINTSTTNNIVVGNGSSPWATLLSGTGTVTLPPGAFFAAGTPDATGWTVTASTGDILLITGTSGQTYSIVILGASS